GFLEHVDLVLVRRGERIRVEVPLQVTGEVTREGMLSQSEVQVEVEADATRIPGEIVVDVDGMEVGDTVYAKDLTLPSGVGLAADEEQLILHVMPIPTAEEVEA